MADPARVRLVEEVVPATPREVCEVCEADDFAPLFSLAGDRGSYRQCRACGMVALDTTAAYDYAGPDYVEALLRQALSGERLYARILDHVERHHAVGTLVEVGCSVGTQLHIAKKRGWEVLGFELNPDCPPIAEHLYRVEVRGTDFTTLDEKDLADVVLMNQFIEHVPDPRPFLAACRRVLRPGGLVAMATPNWNFAAPFAWLHQRAGVPLPPIDHIRPPQHVRLYSPRSMATLAERNGFLLRAVVDNPTDFLGGRSRWSPRRLVADATRLLERATSGRVLLGMNMLAILELRG